ncbi:MULTISPECIES: glycosyltransferase [Marinobacter]|uniref:glycosyltransferase n=1 Tax=Marinobacter TaxID=2742 RepID=UPI003008BF30
MLPKLTMIIPCFNEEEHLSKCLNSIADQDYPQDLIELLIVDNGSTDNSLNIAQNSSAKIHVKPNINVGAVRNYGARNAEGEILVFLDADCSLDTTWISRAVELVSEQPNTVFGGGCLLPPNAQWVETCWLLENEEGNVLPRELLGCSIVLPKAIFEFSGGFDESLPSGEDSEFSSKLKELSFQVTLTRDLNVVHWGNAKSLSDFFKRQTWHGMGYKKRMAESTKDPVFLIILLFLLLATVTLLSLPFNRVFSYGAISGCFFLPAILTAKRYLRAKRKPDSLPEIFKCYILDTLYVIGRAKGLIFSEAKRQ